MRWLYQLTAIIILSFTACKKETNEPIAHPQMQYFDLNNVAIKFGQRYNLDLNKDNKADFGIETLLVGDPIFKQDKQQFYITSNINRYLFISSSETTPQLNVNDVIATNNSNNHQWFDIGAIILAEKIIPEGNAPYWQGNWKDAERKFLPIQLKDGDLRYNGWIELSFNTIDEKVILHKAALSKEAEKDIKAGL